jgi:hypothetical protein
MTRGWRIYFSGVAFAALTLTTLALTARAERDRIAQAPLNLAAPIHAKITASPESPRSREVLATPDPRVEVPTTNDAADIARALDAPRGEADPTQYMLNNLVTENSLGDPVPPEVRRLGDEAVASYLDSLEVGALNEYVRAYSLRNEDPKRALAMFRRVEARTAAGTELHAKAKEQSAQELAALRPEAEQLSRSSMAIGRQETAAAAASRFKTIVAITAPDDALHLAAQAQLDRLSRADLR